MVVDSSGHRRPDDRGARSFLPSAIRSLGQTGPPQQQREFLRLSPDTTARLRALAAGHALDLPSLISAAWAILLSRHCGEDQVVFGFGAGSGEIAPLYVHVRAEQLLFSWLSGTAAAIHAPAAERCETALVFGSTETLHDLHLVLYIDPSGPQLQILAQFDASRFLDGAVPHLLGQMKTVLEFFAAAGTGDPVSAVPLLTEAERRQLVVDWNDTRIDFRRDACISRGFEEQAQRTPDRPAVIFHGQPLSYRDLNQKADRLAARLQELGAGPDTIVGICAHRSLAMMVGLLGIMKAGAAYMPLDPAFPAERTRFMLEDSQAPILVTQEHLAARFQGSRAQIVLLGSLWEGPPADPCPSAARGHHLAYVTYTSGSTGKPKGVMVEHRQVSNFFAAMDRLLGPEPGVWLAVTSISFDISVLELFWTLARGFTVILLAESEKLVFEGEHSVAAQIRNHAVTHLQCTPSMARFLVSNQEAFASLRNLSKLLLGGEGLPPALAAQLRAAVSAEIFNLYGPTETTVWSAAYRVTRGEPVIPIGRPLANTRVYILDAQRQPVPPGAPGELFIAGEGVTRGYLNRPELTAEKFVPDTLHGDSSERMYRTGDLARYRYNGDIEFLGRIDNQVKILGFRIEPEEIEAVLGRHADVQAIAVVARAEPSGEQKLVAYVVPRRPGWDAGGLRAYAHEHLPAHMVPAAFLPLDALLYTANRKLDRKALAALDLPPAAAPPEISGTVLQTRIAGLFQKALGVDAVGVEDNFFDLGANSLVVAEVALALQDTLGRELPLTDLFQYPTIRALTAHLTATPAVGVPADRGSDRAKARKEALQLRSGDRERESR